MVEMNLPVIKDQIFTIPWPQHPFRPGYKISLEAQEYETFLDPEFALREKEKSLKVLKIALNLDPESVQGLPCGMDELLVSAEFEAIEHELVEVELNKWKNVNKNTGMPDG